MLPVQKKGRQPHLSQESEEELKPKKRSRVRRQIVDSEEEEKTSEKVSEKVEDVSEGMDVDEEDLSALPE